MTILDRLARKGAVERSKVGRAYLYRANLSAEEARTHAVGQVIENFFGGSPEALLSQLHKSGVRIARTGSLRSAAAAVPGGTSAGETPAVMAAAAGAASASLSSEGGTARATEPSAAEQAPQPSRGRLDETLL